jgi:regulator of sirC expression with transglutaminase-like and TPR domain
VDLTHSSIDWLLQQHQGLPIVVAVLIITLAHGLGLEAYGVNYPGHFLLRAQGDLVDPLSLAVVEPSSLKRPQATTWMNCWLRPSPPRWVFVC